MHALVVLSDTLPRSVISDGAHLLARKGFQFALTMRGI